MLKLPIRPASSLLSRSIREERAVADERPVAVCHGISLSHSLSQDEDEEDQTDLYLKESCGGIELDLMRTPGPEAKEKNPQSALPRVVFHAMTCAFAFCANKCCIN